MDERGVGKLCRPLTELTMVMVEVVMRLGAIVREVVWETTAAQRALYTSESK